MQAAATALEDDAVLILQAVRPPSLGGGGGRAAGGLGGGNGGGGRSRRSHSVSAESIRIPTIGGLRWPAFQLQPGASAIPEEKGVSAMSPWSPASARSLRPQQPLQPSQRRRSSIALAPAAHREGAPSNPNSTDQLLRAVQSVEVIESQDEWTLVTRQSGATFWLSRRTGQFKSHAPNSVYRAQAVEMKKLHERIGQLESELTSSQPHLGKLKTEQVPMNSEDLRPALEEKDAQLMRLNHSLERVKSELSQRDELVKLKEAELTRRSKEIQKLGEKIQRVDALMAELLDTQERKNQLEQQLREREFELSQTQRQLQIAVTEKTEATAAERTTRLRCDNLMEQVRIEVERTAALEERLGDLEKASDARVHLEAEVERLTRAARDAELLVASSRRVQRAQSDQLAAARSELQQLRAEHESVMAAMEARESAARRELTEALAASDRHRRTATGLRSLLAELKRQVPGSAAWIDTYLASSGSGSGSGGGNDCSVIHRRHSERLLNGRPSSTAPLMQFAHRVSEANADNTAVLDSVEKASDASGAYVAAGKTAETPRSENSRITAGSATEGSSSTNGVGVGSRASRQLRERVAALYIHLGDRVTVRLAGGRTAEAVVKYIGPQPVSGGRSRRGSGARYGLRLLGKEADAAESLVAAADATEAAQFRSDLLAPAKRIECVYNQRANSFRQLDELVNDYLKMCQRSC